MLDAGISNVRPDAPGEDLATPDRPPMPPEVEAGPDTNPEIGPDSTLVDAHDGGQDADAPPEVGPDVPETGPDVPDGGGPDGDGGGPDGDGGGPDGDGGDTDAGCHSGIEPPVKPCWNGHCLTLTPTMRNGAVLWLDPNNLGTTGDDVSIWCDQSGHKNEAYIANYGVVVGTVLRSGGLMLDTTQVGAGLDVVNDPSLNFGADDFTMLVVAGFTRGTTGQTFFRKANDDLNFPKQVALDTLSYPGQGFRLTGHVNETVGISSVPTDPGTDRVYVLRKAGSGIEVRVNGIIEGTSQLLTPGQSTDNDSDLYIGTSSYADPVSVDTIRAAIVIHGSLSEIEVGQLETFLLAAFNLS